MNTTMSSKQLQSILDLADQKGLNPDRTKLILSSGVLADLFDSSADLSDRKAIRQAMKLCPEQIVLVVDYSQDLEAMIVAGRYDSRNDNITAKHFPIVGTGRVEFEAKLFHYDRDIDPGSNEAECMIKAADIENPWKPGKIEHLLSFGETLPEEQRKYPIVALGSSAEVTAGHNSVPHLGRKKDSDRSLGLCLKNGGWTRFCRFLAVRTLRTKASLFQV
jgi:hypothetical protein